MPPILMETSHHHHHHLLILLLLLIIITTLPTTTTQTLPSPSPSPSLPPPPPPPPPPSLPPQLNNIIDALIGAGDFSIWVSILTMSNSNSTLLPLSATLFIPQDTTLLNNNNNNMLDPFLLPYHVVPQRLTFSDLLLFRRNARLPTLLPGKSISVTDNSPANFSLDATPITHPDLYSTASVAVHAVAKVLDYSLFGDGVPPPPPPFMPVGETVGLGWRSGAPAAGDASLWVHVAFLALVILLQELFFFGAMSVEQNKIT